ISFNEGGTWTTERNQPTGQFYRVNADNRFPYYVYGGQQDDGSVMIASRNTSGDNIGEKDWTFSAGSESAFLAFDPNNPRYVMGGSYQGTIDVLDQESKEDKPVMAAPIQYQALKPKDMKYRFNWNAPIVNSPNDPTIFYHAANVLIRTANKGTSWEVISPDLTRHDTTKMGLSGIPYTNEGAGGENYATIAYVAESPLGKGVIWTGSDDGLVYLTRDNAKTWVNVTPKGLPECLINCIEVSPHEKATAYIATTRYKFDDLAPAIYKTSDYGSTWTNISAGIPYGAYTRCIREDDVQKDLLYAGTETGFYISYNGGKSWKHQQLNLPVTPITDLMVHKNNLIASTMGRAIWILDDVNIFRQFHSADTMRKFELFKPADSYRVSGGSALDATPEDDDDKPTISAAGTNPPTGVSIYYLVPAKPDSVKLTLEILNEKGQLVRLYSTKPDKKFVKFPGGPEAEPLLPNKPGLNHFVWDMRYTTLPGVADVFIEGSYKGRKVAPGKYQVKLKKDSIIKTADFTILPDPRINASATDYLQQQQTMAETDNKIKEIHEAVTQMRLVRKQVTELADLLTDTLKYKPVIDSGKALVKKLTAWEEKLVQPKSQSNDDVINFTNMLSANYIFLKGEMDVNIPTVTLGQQQRLAELNADWLPIKKEYDALQKNVEEYNALCRRMQIEKITIPEVR
ncbi:MAG: glycosyl hydrolase, partial [Bacteroidota bacterium]|nr:glycosyl hydrolase [Bacteroidota bacterium]